MSTKEKLVTFARMITRAAMIRKAVSETEANFVGCEVLERLMCDPDAPTGQFEIAVITAVEWDNTVFAPGGAVGDWCIKIRYISNGYETWTNQSALTLTGTKYDDAGAAVIQAAHDAQMRMEVSHE